MTRPALAVGTYLNIFVRKCAWVRMANMAQLVNAIAPIVTTSETAVVQPIYYPFLLHSQGHLDTAVDVLVDGPTVDAPAPGLSRWTHRLDDLQPFTLIDAAATRAADGTRVAVTLVNRSQDSERVEIGLRDRSVGPTATVRVVTGRGERSSVAGVEPATVDETEEHATGGVLVLDLPASSFALVQAEVI